MPTTTTNIIKVQFMKGAVPAGREYSYYTPESVEVDDVVDISITSDKGRATRGMVTQVNVPGTEIAVFNDKVKSIIGKTTFKCETCNELTAIGEGDHLCGMADPPRMVLSDYIPTNDYGWCRGAHWTSNDV